MGQKGCSPLEGQVFRFVVGFIDQTGYPPAVREIQEGLGISSSSVVSYHLHALRANGLISFVDKFSRTITVTQVGRQQMGANGDASNIYPEQRNDN